jgi:hypothetical protein
MSLCIFFWNPRGHDKVQQLEAVQHAVLVGVELGQLFRELLHPLLVVHVCERASRG